MVIHSRKPARYKCKVCNQTFSSKVGTPFHRLHYPPELVTCVMTLIAFGCPVQAIVAAYGLDESLIGEIVQRVWSTALARPLLICVDGLRSYISAIQAAFRSPVHYLPEPKAVAE